MNKARRHELKMLKYKKRLKQLNLKAGEGRFNCFRTTGKPCSCAVCSPYKYDRAKTHKPDALAEYWADEDNEYWESYLLP